MTYWYETPDDQKDTWHWMGVAISLAHTIGLHRNPEKSNMDIKKQKDATRNETFADRVSLSNQSNFNKAPPSAAPERPTSQLIDWLTRAESCG